eukprot:5971972-Prymnesium_polylepis.2
MRASAPAAPGSGGVSLAVDVDGAVARTRGAADIAERLKLRLRLGHVVELLQRDDVRSVVRA